jgi:AcrR family transcriptional regulator
MKLQGLQECAYGLLVATAQEETGLGRRDLKKQQTRDALAAAALHLAADRGIDHITVEEISAAAGVSPRTFFNYFATKDDAVLSDSTIDAAAIQARLAALLPKLPVLQAIQRSLLLTIAAMEADRDRWFLRMEVVQRSPSLLPRLVAAGADSERAMADIIAGHLGVPVDGYPMLAAAVTGTAFRVAMSRWAAAAGELSLGGLIDQAFQALAAGLRDPR